MLEGLAPFHPRMVHFPIALSLVGALFAAAGLLRRDERWFGYGQLSLLLAGLSTLAAGITGLVDQARAPDDPVVAALINQHITVAIALGVVTGLVLYWPLRYKRLFSGGQGRWGYLALLALLVMLVFATGWLGGQLVYRFGVGVQ